MQKHDTQSCAVVMFVRSQFNYVQLCEVKNHYVLSCACNVLQGKPDIMRKFSDIRSAETSASQLLAPMKPKRDVAQNKRHAQALQ